MQNVYTVRQVNAYIKSMFTQDVVLRSIYMKGEVSNCKYHTSGHIYFSLKDETGILSCVMFAGQRKGLAFAMKNGDRVVVTGSVDVYERDGKYQMYARKITLEGAGILYERFLALKEELEEKLGTELLYAAAAIPPGVSEGSVKSIGYVLEGAGFEVTNIVDEPTAAAAVLKITDGAVVDVGGGTTGISILKDGKVIYTDDEATGGSHMTMTVAGHYRIPYEEAEVLKTTPEKEKEIFPVIKATVEKMASITEKFLKGYEIPAVYVVGGSASFQEFTSVFEKKLNLPVYRPVHPLLVTPLGIAYNCQLPQKAR